MGMICCNCSLIKNEGAISTYEVSDTVQIENFTKDVKVCVYFNIEEFELKCTCALFETRGILCRHTFSVFRAQCGDTSLPSKYILDRWRKDLACNYTLIKSSYDNLRANPDTQRHDHLMSLFSEVAKLISRNEERYSNMVDHLLDVKDQCSDLMCEPRPSEQIVPTNRSAKKGKKVLSPNVVRGKGRPPTRWKVSTLKSL
ncbi:protein FAR-RED IMPAIRED RESPONSE 1-like [Juglans regia]|uniref:Protein FAR1-RELATED SEQUENCE n=1 Tax=Juglans regia TaxID=51240 RepID=A0A6P9EPZ5_JUGRE|nr:protein FAR-RED IMPAIRED RESPONSE 1-like [Juglans regia]